MFCLNVSYAQNPPTITAFTPLSADVGSTINITGTNFNTTPANNVVFFGATQAIVSDATATNLNVVVPAGATYGPITVLNTATALVAYSVAFFNPTFTPTNNNISTADFAPKVDFQTGTGPHSMAIGDIDGDGKIDIVVANRDQYTVSVFRNTCSNGLVNFENKVDFPTGTYPTSVAINDIDGDGKLDLVVVNEYSSSVSVFLNTGSIGLISFATKVDFAIGGTPYFLSIGDIDGDGKPDVIVAHHYSNYVSVLRNNGSVGLISFASKVNFITGNHPWSVTIGDIDNDNKPDIATANFHSNTLSVLGNTSTIGSLSFDEKVDFDAGTNPSSLAICDINRDGKHDLIAANRSSNSVSVFRNTGSNGLVDFENKVDFSTGDYPSSVAMGDFDGDGMLDFALADGSITVHRNTGRNGLVDFATKVDLSSEWGTPVALTIGDIDGDGKADLAFVSFFSNIVSILRNTPINTPSIITTPISNFTATSAFMGGNITEDGGASVTERGVVYSSNNSLPEIGGSGVSKVSIGFGLGIYTANIRSLAPNTMYYVQSYAINTDGVSYGSVQSFTTQAGTELFLNNVSIAPKVFDGTTTANVTDWGAPTGLIPPDVTNIIATGYVANFADAAVGDNKLVNITANVAPSNTNYFITLPFTATGNIIPPVYAMFTPTYDVVGTRPTLPIENVAVNAPLSIEFSTAVVDMNGDALPWDDLGDFITLEKWDANFVQYDHIACSSVRAGNKITITPSTPLEYNSQYRLRFAYIYKTNADGGGLVVYSLDGVTRDSSIVGALQIDNSVVFKTMSIEEGTLPSITPYGPDNAVCGEMKLTFVNPVQYLNGNQITDNARHKFCLQYSIDNFTWNNVPVTYWNVSINVPGNPTEFTFTYVPGNYAYNYYYRIKNNIGIDWNYGFVDKVTGLTLLSSEFMFNHTQGNNGWWWSTISTYPITVDVAPWPISPVFPAIPDPSDATFDAVGVVTVGAAPGYALTKDTDFTADVTLTHNFEALEGEGYHFTNWKRSTNGGSSYTTLPTTAPLVAPNIGVNYAPQTFSVSGDNIKPASCTESIAYQANFAINTYTVSTSVAPAATGTATGGGSGKVHGSTVTLTATPAAGQKFVSWDYTALPASVQATITEVIPDASALGYSGQPATITFSLVGPLSHGDSWNVVANFAEFTPRLYVATDPQDMYSGQVNITIEFGNPPNLAEGIESSPFQGILYKWEEYIYDTPVRIETWAEDCRYEFVKWQKWNPNTLPAGAWEDFSLVNPTVFFGVTSNLRVKALYKLIDDVHVSATANNADLATVIIFTDATRTTPLTINDITGADFSFGETVYITSYPEPDYYTWRWTDAAGAPVTMGGPVRFEDRSEWTYTVGCNDIDLKAVIDLKEYEVVVTSLVAQGHINGSNPAFNAATGNQGGLGFSFATVGADRVGEGYFQRNSTVNFVATATGTDYNFSHWEAPGGSVVSTANPYTVPAIQGDIELEAIFDYNAPPIPTYALTVVYSPVAGGNVNVPSGNYPVGNITATATAADGYTFTGWTASGITLTVPQQTANPMTFAMPGHAVTLTANYVQTEYTVTPVSRGYLRPHTSFTIVDWGGSVSRTPATGTFNAGETVQFTATPNPGFRFVNWMVGEILPGEILRGVEVSDMETFTWTVPAVTGNPPMYVYAIFVEIAIPEYPIYTLSTEANPAGFGTVYGAGDFAHSVQVYVEQEVTEPGYEFAGWTGNVNPAGDYVDMIQDEHIVANYTKINYMLHVESNNPAWGNVTPAAAGFVVGDLPIAVQAFEAPTTCSYSYEFAGWFTDPMLTTPLLDAGGNAVVDADFNFIPYALPYPQTDVWVYAKFNQVVNEYDVTATVSPVAAGTATVDVAGPYTCGQTITFSTMANPGYEFQHWTKDGVLFIDQTTFNWNVDEDADFVAVYAAIEYNVTATATAGGTAAPAAQIKTIGQVVEIVATTNEGYVFTGWESEHISISDSLANPLIFTMPQQDVAVTAKFAAVCDPGIITGPNILCMPDLVSYQTTGTAGGNWSVDKPGYVNLTPNPTAGTVMLEALQEGVIQLAYTLSNCIGEPAAFIEITISGIADAGPDQLVCGSLQARLSASEPIVGQGFWTQTSGPGILVFQPNIYDPSALIISQTAGTYTLSWANQLCPTSDALTVQFVEDPVVNPTLSMAPLVACEGIPVTLSVQPHYSGSVSSYIWYLNGNIMPGVTGSNYTTFYNAGDEVSVDVTVENSCGDLLTFSTETLTGFIQDVALETNVFPEQTGTIEQSGTISIGSDVNLHATANIGWQFDSWQDTQGNILGSDPDIMLNLNNCQTEITAHFSEACAPDWTVTNVFEYNMQVIGSIHSGDGFVLNPNYRIGAFVRDECRGIARPLTEADGKFFLSIGSNQEEGETVDLRIWDSESCSSCYAAQYFSFTNLSELGSLQQPLEVSCGSRLVLDFPEGFTWFSTNIQQQTMETNHILSDLSPCYNDRLIGQTSFAVFTGEQWMGSLQQLTQNQMYKLKLCKSEKNRFRGVAAPVTPIALNSGYSWLGYPLQSCVSIQDALAALNPAPSYNDRLIGQDVFSVYTGTSWIGSLDQLCPGDGFIIKLSQNSILQYPENNDLFVTPEEKKARTLNGQQQIQYQQHTMMMIAKLDFPVGYNQHTDDVIYAFIDEELRGSGVPEEDVSDLFFISVGENSEESKQITFKWWSAEKQQLLPLNESISFEPLAAIGNLDNPFIFTLGEMVGIGETNAGIWIGEPYPNPFTEQTTVPIYLPEDVELTYSIYDIRGVVMRNSTRFDEEKGLHQLIIHGSGLSKGVYVLKIQSTDKHLNQNTIIRLIHN